eukprot:m.42068 g.42068  ORF g.42068 m.42068 type:complete len:322 (+) comp9839_c1_seq1:42-1007(+)
METLSKKQRKKLEKQMSSRAFTVFGFRGEGDTNYSLKLLYKKDTKPEETQEQKKLPGKSMPVDENILKDTEDPRILPELEAVHVKNLYDSIATHWHGTRYKAWPRVASFIQSLPRPSLIADVGCGNGKNMPDCNKNGFVIGCDISIELCKICRAFGFEVFAGDIMTLPFRNEVFDAVISIAVFHHTSTRARRLLAIQEIVRIMKVGASALIYAWALEQEGSVSGHKFDTQDVFVPWHFKTPTPAKKPSKNPAFENPLPEHLLPKQTTEENTPVFNRYCHVYKEGELDELVGEFPEVEIISSEYDTGNWVISIRKTAVSEKR